MFFLLNNQIVDVFGQSLDGTKKFYSFLNLFTSINYDDTEMHMHEIELADYPNYNRIDTSFYSFIDPVPFFNYYATFKIKKNNGFLVCIYYRYTNQFATTSFIDFVTFSLDGEKRESVKLPFYDDAVYYDYPVGMDICDLFVSGNKIIYEYKSYRKKNDKQGKTLQRKILHIDEDGGLENEED